MSNEVIECLSDADIAAEVRATNKIKAVPAPPVEGQLFKLCGVDVTVPALKVKHLVKYASQMQQLSKVTSDTPPEEIFLAALPIITAALQRNYPSLTSDDVTELLDVAVLPAVTISIMGGSGYRALKPGEK
ncbi:MAG TPA: hypothetical protein VN577_10090 [Terriglobales bacterium]|nr:hypothetical protein [Terriglobales bacterium]